MTSPDKTTVLVCPLDWGLGHASRVIPVIWKFRAQGYKVLLGGAGKSAELLQHTFPDLKFVFIPSARIRYPFTTGGLLVISLVFQLPALMYSSFHEHRFLRNLIRQFNIGCVVSDNRYGLYNRKTHNILITHQISPVLPRILSWLEYPLYRWLRSVIGRFDECWIPDYGGNENLSGILSHRFTRPHNARFTGPLSRFSLELSDKTGNEVYDMVIILSGPQPELRKFTQKVIGQCMHVKLKILIICGFQKIHSDPGRDIKIVSHLEPEDFKSALKNAKIIISNGGYSGITDLTVLGKTAVLVPTRGQTEQEYLCRHLADKKYFITVSQQELDLSRYAEYMQALALCTPLRFSDSEALTDLFNGIQIRQS